MATRNLMQLQGAVSGITLVEYNVSSFALGCAKLVCRCRAPHFIIVVPLAENVSAQILNVWGRAGFH